MRNKCHCCGELTLEELDNYEICEVCGWEDDDLQSEDPSYPGGANEMCLNDYKKWYFENKD